MEYPLCRHHIPLSPPPKTSRHGLGFLVMNPIESNISHFCALNPCDFFLNEHSLSQKTFRKNVSKYSFTIMTKFLVSFLLTIVFPMAEHSMEGKIFYFVRITQWHVGFQNKRVFS